MTYVQSDGPYGLSASRVTRVMVDIFCLEAFDSTDRDQACSIWNCNLQFSRLGTALSHCLRRESSYDVL